MFDVEPLSAVANALSRAGIPFALGGSGLLNALGLTDQVRDWDLTTDASLPAVRAALGDLPWQVAPHSDGSFASECRLTVTPGAGPEVDLIIRFAIRTEAGTCRLPTIVAGEWQGVAVGSPEVWAVAYRLMQRHAKADLLSQHLRRSGASAEAVGRLLAEPLPDSLRSEVLSWPT